MCLSVSEGEKGDQGEIWEQEDRGLRLFIFGGQGDGGPDGIVSKAPVGQLFLFTAIRIDDPNAISALAL